MARNQQSQKPMQDMFVVDCDVHQEYKSEEEFTKYLPDHYRDRGITGPGQPGWHNPVSNHGIARNDTVPESGGPPASDYDLLCEHVFGDFNVDYAVLTGPTSAPLSLHPNLHYATAAMEAYNDWLIEEWLEQDDRLLGGMYVAPGDQKHAVEEIKRIGSHDQIVQVMLPGSNEKPYGHKQYWPIYEAAEKAGLPMASHVSSASRGVSWAPATGAGIPLSYFEKHCVGAMPIVGNTVSVVLEGVFEEFPDLDWLWVEGRFTWLPDIMWQMDKNWKGLGDQVPWLKRPPSEYIRDNCWFSTQPSPEPENPEHLNQMLDMVYADETLIFSTDYPHWDNDNPSAIFNSIDDETRQSIFGENAREIYDL